MKLVTCAIGAFIGIPAMFSFSSVALSENLPETLAASEVAATSFVSDGSAVKFDRDRASITPISGWKVEPRGMGMALVMKEIPAETNGQKIDYSVPLFSRNIAVMTLNEPSPIDEARAVSFQEEFEKMATRDGVMKDFQFTSRKFFNYKAENDGIVFFAQHIANGFPMMQMIVLVSSDMKQYVSIYTDLAANFSNQDSYNAAWNSMTSILVPGVAPKRYEREAKLYGSILAACLLLILPFMIARFSSQRRIRRMVAELQKDWDSGLESASNIMSNVSNLDTTRVAATVKKSKKKSDYRSSFDSLDNVSLTTGQNGFRLTSRM
jgi:hypothetical protein